MMWVLSMKEEKYKEIPSQNIVMHKSGPMQKESWRMNCLNMCSPNNGWWANLPKGSDGLKKGNLLGIKGLNRGQKLK